MVGIYIGRGLLESHPGAKGYTLEDAGHNQKQGGGHRGQGDPQPQAGHHQGPAQADEDEGDNNLVR